MVETATTDLIWEWIDESYFDSIEEVDDPNADLNISMSIEQSGLAVHAIKPPSHDHIDLVAQMPIPPDVLATLMDLEYEQTELRIHLTHVLTTLPGWFSFLDDQGQPTEFEEVELISVTHRIYPDGADQQTFMDSVVTILNAMVFIRDIISTTAENIDRRR